MHVPEKALTLTLNFCHEEWSYLPSFRRKKNSICRYPGPIFVAASSSTAFFDWFHWFGRTLHFAQSAYLSALLAHSFCSRSIGRRRSAPSSSTMTTTEEEHHVEPGHAHDHDHPPELWGITFGSGDIVSLFSLFFDNLSSILGLASAILGLAPGNKVLEEIVYERIIPAVGFMLFLGNVYYSYQAIRMTKKYGRPFTAQPYGINGAGGFPFVFGIIYGVYFSIQTVCTEDTCTPEEILEEENDRITTAWQVCVTANFLTGLINIALAFAGRYIVKYFPVAAMLVPLAGIGFTWLALNQISPNFANPAIGLIPVYLIFTQYYAMGRIHVYNGFYLPEAVPIVAFGVAAGWIYGTQDGVVDPVKSGLWVGDAFIQGFSDIGDYIGTVLPFSIAASFGGMMCLVSAQKAGDPYPIAETMLADGLGTLLGAFLGAPFGTVVYIGHPVHKRLGARTGYSMMNGWIYLILCLTGIIPTILSLIPAIAIGPIIFIFGLMICEECTLHIPQRHHCAIFFGIFFGVTDYIFTQYQGNAEANPGPLAMSKGSALSAMIWVAILVFSIDRRWLSAAFFCLVAAFFAGLGIIHQAESFSGDFREGTGGNIKETSAFEFMMGYISLAGVAMIYYLLQKYNGKKLEEDDPDFEKDFGYLQPYIDTEMDDHFDHWFDALYDGAEGHEDNAAADSKLKDSSEDEEVVKDQESVGEA